MCILWTDEMKKVFIKQRPDIVGTLGKREENIDGVR